MKEPEPYCWAVEWTNSVWAFRGENAEELAHSCFAEKPPFLLYREPPVTEESSAAAFMAGLQRGKELALKSKVELNKVCWEGDKLMGTVKAPAGFVGLTHDEVVELIKELWGSASIAPQKAHSFACAIEAKLKEKNQ